ncbi:hypothetical protein [Nonomuraea sp. 10N515B]|uniref:hypothetical protein n=1 Tax=Nonomuraea sp. 10N515B TaxID=3457422 RepID=UPI003FCC517C
MEIALELKAVSKRYGTTIALDGVDLDVAQGQTVAVLGPNGVRSGRCCRMPRSLAGGARPYAPRPSASPSPAAGCDR